MNDVTLIEYYRPWGSQVEAAAEAVRERVPQVRGLAKQVEKDHRHVLDQVAGDLQRSMADAPSRVIGKTSAVIQKAEYAAGCLELFSQAIHQYNYHKTDRPRAVKLLNAEYGAALGSSHRVHDPDSNATAELRQRLFQEARDLAAWLDRQADEIGARLRRGPNVEDVRDLWRAGALSPYAPLVFPAAGLAKIKLPPLAQRELIEDLIAKPELLMAMPPALKAVVDKLPYWSRTQVYVEQRLAHLHKEGLLDGQKPDGFYRQWVRNTYLNNVPIPTVVDIARDHDIRPDDFDVLDGSKEIKDRDGKSFFLLPSDISGGEARKVVLMTYVLNAGTRYEYSPNPYDHDLDFAPTPYSSAEVQRIVDRQDANGWSYDQFMVNFHDEGGRVVATPNGMLVGAAGSWQQDTRSWAMEKAGSGGVCVGDVFVPQAAPDDPERWLEGVVRRGEAPNDPTGALDLDRLLHHEERHSQQWAGEGPVGFLRHYLGDQDKYEKDAGRSDGGYDPP